MRARNLYFAVCLFTALAIRTALADAPLVIEDLALKVDIRGRPVELEAMIVKSSASAGRLPIAILAHGSPRERADRPKYRARTLLPQARDLARRGWLVVAFMRRGFGQSDGPFAEGFDCAAPNFRQALETAAEDIDAVRKAVAGRSDADGARVLGVGASAGGAGLLAWAASRPEGLVGVINISGGSGALLPGRNCDENALVAAVAAFGARARAPTLWLYADNDSYFRPDLVRRMHAAYTRDGGPAKLVSFGPIGKDGHLIWDLYDGRVRWLPELDQFLRTHGLPTWDPRPLEAISGKLHPSQRAVVSKYLSAPSEKVLAVSRDNGRAWFWSNMPDLQLTREKSREGCERAAGQPCDVVAENFVPAAPR